MRSLIPSFGTHNKSDHDPFSLLHREVDRLFSDFSRGATVPNWPFGGNGVQVPSIDVSETEKALEITAELPGVEEKDIDVQLRDDVLTIKAEKKAEKESKEKTYHLVERSYGAFQRSLRVPFSADSNKVEAHFDKGVLKISLPKPAEAAAKATSIKIKSA
mgnify:FL=1